MTKLRQLILDGDADRRVYLLHSLALIGYCLISNLVHLIVTPARPDALARALKETYGRYAAYWNAIHHSSGHVWQGRFCSCPLDEVHLWKALRYTELHPVRATGNEKVTSRPVPSSVPHRRPNIQ